MANYTIEVGEAANTHSEGFLNLVRKIDSAANMISAIIFRQEKTEEQVQIAVGRFRHEIAKARDGLYQTEPSSSRS